MIGVRNTGVQMLEKFPLLNAQWRNGLNTEDEQGDYKPFIRGLILVFLRFLPISFCLFFMIGVALIYLHHNVGIGNPFIDVLVISFSLSFSLTIPAYYFLMVYFQIAKMFRDSYHFDDFIQSKWDPKTINDERQNEE